jgi:hypothetical protein
MAMVMSVSPITPVVGGEVCVSFLLHMVAGMVARKDEEDGVAPLAIILARQLEFVGDVVGDVEAVTGGSGRARAEAGATASGGTLLIGAGEDRGKGIGFGTKLNNIAQLIIALQIAVVHIQQRPIV